ncbi:MAG: thioredoxin-dependent thiol peroxidase [Deinococcales bacterium]|nr:thioredoxin-dependent thiol peroxidase [Deinococcales bacterium]
MLEVGQQAPDFNLEDHNGRFHRLSDQRGDWVVLYFYPKDDTPGCTQEACEFRDNMSLMESSGAKVFGVSADDKESHQSFASKHELNFPLLIDPDKKVLDAYGAYGEKQTFGNKHMGVFRVTYLIDPNGKIAHVWPKVTPQGHADEVRRAIEELKAATA